MFLISPLGLKLYMRAKELIIFTYIFDKPLYKPKREKKIQYYNRNYYRQQKKKINPFITELPSIHTKREVHCNSSNKE